MTVTVDMIKSFIDVEGGCRESYPCKHGPFEVELHDGRKTSAYLRSPEIYSILQGLKDIGVNHKDWDHFSLYKNFGVNRPVDVILTEIFKNYV